MKTRIYSSESTISYAPDPIVRYVLRRITAGYKSWRRLLTQPSFSMKEMTNKVSLLCIYHVRETPIRFLKQPTR